MSQSTNFRKSRVVGKLFVDCAKQSHIVYESEGRHCTAICGKYVCGPVSNSRSKLPKCRQCKEGNLKTKTPRNQCNGEISMIELRQLKTRTGRRVYKRFK